MSAQLALSIGGFESGSIDPGNFDHEAHVYVGWLYLQQNDVEQAIDKFTAALKRLTRKLGVESKYHDTITKFYLILIAERLSSSKSDDWQSFKRDNPDVFATQPSVIDRYYSSEKLGSPLARRQFVLPDRIPALEKSLDSAV
ncbi:MAG: tetratricopeptide repeat protein [Woeseia sp.]